MNLGRIALAFVAITSTACGALAPADESQPADLAKAGRVALAFATCADGFVARPLIGSTCRVDPRTYCSYGPATCNSSYDTSDDDATSMMRCEAGRWRTGCIRE